MKSKRSLFFVLILLFVVFAGTQLVSASHEEIFDFMNVRAENMFGSGAQIKWSTNGQGDSKVVYGTTPGGPYDFTSINRCDANGFIMEHCVNLTGLTSNTLYYYRAKSDTPDGMDGTSVEYSFIAGSDIGLGSDIVPPAPSGLQANISAGTLSGYGNVHLTWQDNSTNETRFEIWFSFSAGGTLQLLANSLGPNTISYTDSGTPAGTYDYVVKACNIPGCASSNIVTVTIADSTSVGSVPAAPSDFAVTNLTNLVDVRLDWTDNSGDETRFDIYEGLDGATPTYKTGVGTDITSYTRINLSNGTHNYYVKACNSYGCSSASNMMTVTINSLTTNIPAAPSDLIAELAPNGYDVYLRWFDNSTTEDRFEIFYRYQGDESWTYRDSTPIDVISYIDAPPVGTIEYKVSACNSTGCADSNIATVQVGDVAGGTVPAAPTDLVVKVKSNGVDVRLDWRDNADNEEWHEIWWASSGSLFDWLVTLEHNVESYTYINIPSGVYDFMVQACNSFDCSGSNITTVTIGGSSDFAQVTGKVTDATGAAVSGAFVEIHTENWTSSYGGQTSANGTYTISNIPSGAYLLDVRPPLDRPDLISPTARAIILSAGQTLTENLSFTRAVKTIRGTVKRNNGSAVIDASIGAFQNATGRRAEARTDSTGNYILNVAGGTWEVSVHPTSVESGWNYNQEPKKVSFTKDNISEEKTMNFIVSSTDAFVTGKVIKEDGTLPAEFTVFVELRSADGFRFGTDVKANGSFSVAVAPGSYEVFIRSNSQDLVGPDLAPITIASGQTKSLGTIMLTSKSDHIKGRVVDVSGAGIGGVEVKARQSEGFGYAFVKTDSSGNFDLIVTPGTWEVSVYADPSKNLYNPNPSQRVKVESGVVARVVFTLFAADATISGIVVDGQGNVLADLYGRVELAEDFALSAGIGGPIDRGTFMFNAPAGTYKLVVHFSSDSSYTPGDPQTVTLTSGVTTRVAVTVNEATATITGFLKDASGNVVTGWDAFVFATQSAGVWREAHVESTTGRYTLNVSAGTWYFGYKIVPESGFVAQKRDITVTVLDGATVTQDLVLTKAGATIIGRVIDPNGSPVFGAFIGASLTGFKEVAQSTELKDPIVSGVETDSQGFYIIKIPAGSYFVKTFVSPESGYLAAPAQNITVAEGQILTVNFSLRTAAAKITGIVLQGGIPVFDAFVWGWSETGGFQFTTSRADGSYELPVTLSEKWVVAAVQEINGEFYRADEIAIEVGTIDVVYDISLSRVGALPLAETQTTTATSSIVISTSDGAQISAPANSISTSGSVSVSISPDTRTISQGEVRVVGIAYDVEARDQQGQLITKLNSEVTVTLPYTDENVASLGMKEDNLVMSFWDETVSTWKTFDNSIVNKEENTVNATTTHFTRFAIVSAADITPPSAPTNVSAVEESPGTLFLSWTNPTLDFHHIKIYRSLISGELGTIILNDITDTSARDTDVAAGTLYYYTVRAIDPAGNESANTAQVSALSTSQGTAIVDGDLVTTTDSFDIFIVKRIGDKKFKRLILNPAIFESYGHLQWENVKTISRATIDTYAISELVIEVFPDGSIADPKVYRVTSVPNADVGVRYWLNLTAAAFEAASYDWDAIYHINHTEASPDFYPIGEPITSS